MSTSANTRSGAMEGQRADEAARAIAAIDEAYAKATPGLWGWCTTGEKCNAAMLGTFFTFDDACTPLGGHVERWGENGKQVADWDEAIAYKEDNASYADFDFIAAAHNNWPAARAHIRTLEAENARLTAALADAKAEGERMREALTPSADTKAAYSGEFSWTERSDSHLDYTTRTVPWTVVKEIMEAIRDRAALASSGQDAKAAQEQ